MQRTLGGWRAVHTHRPFLVHLPSCQLRPTQRKSLRLANVKSEGWWQRVPLTRSFGSFLYTIPIYIVLNDSFSNSMYTSLRGSPTPLPLSLQTSSSLFGSVRGCFLGSRASCLSCQIRACSKFERISYAGVLPDYASRFLVLLRIVRINIGQADRVRSKHLLC